MMSGMVMSAVPCDECQGDESHGNECPSESAMVMSAFDRIL